MNPFEMVKEFHKTYGMPAPDTRSDLTEERFLLRCRLIEEEYGEFVDAAAEGDFVEMADALGDLIYVVYGTAVEMGIDLDAIITEIHRSNMSKLGEDGKPIYREDGKVLKGPNFFQPKLKEIIYGER